MNRATFNGVKTTLLLGLMWTILFVLGWWLSETTGSVMWILGFAGFGLISTVFSYWFSDKLALQSMNARQVGYEEFPWFHETVGELAAKAGKPVPRLYVSPSPSPNAFATGRDPDNAAVCVTEGILNLLDRRELRAVLGHELMHVYNRDILTSSVAAGMAGLIGSIGHLFLFRVGGRRNALAALIIALLAPFLATLIQLAISRSREYEADHDGSELSADPLGLASALSKISGGVAAAPLDSTPINQSISHLMIANPLSGMGAALFSTHPPMRKRIARLEKMVDDQ